MLADAGVTGNAYNDYAMGGFLGYWVAPELRAYVNGTLNVTPEVMDANLPIRERRGVREGESFLALLDRLGIDVFVGIHPPQVAPGRRPWYRTTAHLEGAPGWVPVFRNMSSAVYLRDAPRHAANFERIEAWYAAQGVPFERGAGFDPARVLRKAPDWSLRHGLSTPGHEHLGAISLYRDSDGVRALTELGFVYASLGLYERCVDVSRRRLQRGETVPARRRLVWALLQLGRDEEARAAAKPLTELPEGDALSQTIAEAAELYPTLDSGQAAALRARLPLFTPGEAQRLLSNTMGPPVRPPRKPVSLRPEAPARGA
jgi:hypothetical protein